jgi:hypothetical protein
MKSKLVLTTIIISLAFIFSSNQFVEKSQEYHTITKISINKFDLKNHKLSQQSVNCTRCHDCKNNVSEAHDSTQTSINPSFDNWNANSEEYSIIKKAEGNITSEKDLKWNDNLSPDNFKIK